MRKQTKKFNQLATDVKRYKELKAKLNPGNHPFVIMDNSDDSNEFNLLTIKLTSLLVNNVLSLTQTK